MAQILKLAQLDSNGLENLDISINEVVVGSLTVGGASGTNLTKTELDLLIADAHAPMSDNQNVVAGNGLTGGGSGATVTLDIAAADASIAVNTDNIAVARDGGGAIGLTGSGLAINTDNATLTIITNILQIANLGVTTAKLADNSVTSAKLESDPTVDANRAVSTNHIKDTAVTDAKIAAGVNADKIADGSVSNTVFEYIANLTSDAQTQLNSKVPQTRNINTSAPLTGGGALSGDLTLAITQASTSTNGYLSSTDWNTFNSKQPAGNYITALTSDVSAAGPGSAAATIQPNVVTNAKLAQMPANTVKANTTALTANAADVSLGTLTETTSSVLTLSGWTDATIGSPTITVKQSSGSQSGYLSSTDWTTFNGKVSSVTASAPLASSGGTTPNLTITTGSLTEATSSVLTIVGTNTLLAGTTIQVKQASGSQSGYLSSTDWNTFNNKQSALTFGNLTDAGTDGITVTGGTGAVIGTGTSIAQHVADTTHNGYLSSTDWNTFNGKQNPLTYVDASTYLATGLAASTPITLPGSASFNSSTAADIFIIVNKQILEITRDFTTVGVAPFTQIQFNYALPNDTVLRVKQIK